MSPMNVARLARDYAEFSGSKKWLSDMTIAKPIQQTTSIIGNVPSQAEEPLIQTVSYLDALKASKTALLADSIHPTAALGSHRPDVLGGSWASLRDAAKQLEITNSGMDYLADLAARRQVDPYEESDQFTPDFLPSLGALTLNQFLVEITASTASETSGPHFTFIDPGLHLNERAMILGARRLMEWMKVPHPYDGWDIPVEDMIISIPATKQGVEATKVLSKEGVRINLYSVGNLPHALACVEAGAEWISIPVDAVMYWYEGLDRRTSADAIVHPGIQSIETILAYFKMKKLATKIVGMDFRRTFSQMDLACLAGFDAVCLSEWHLDRRLRNTVPSGSLDAFSRARRMTEGEGMAQRFMADILDELAQKTIESELMTQDILSKELQSMNRSMAVIESAVQFHTFRRFSIAYRGEWPDFDMDDEPTLPVDPADEEISTRGSFQSRESCPSPEWPTLEGGEDGLGATAIFEETPTSVNEADPTTTEESKAPVVEEKFEITQLARKQTRDELLRRKRRASLIPTGKARRR